MKTRTRARTAWIAVLAALLVAGSASAAEVVKVRVGNHPTYTRVVFELDATAGYRIEQHQGDAGSEIRITLDASSSPFHVDRKTVMVEKVALEASTGRSVAHIQLRKTPSRVKEMILSNPPRIVFDLVFPESQLAAIRRRAEQKKAAAKPPPEKPVAVAKQQPKTAAPVPATVTPAPSTATPAPSTAKPLAKKTAPPPPARKPAPAPIAKQPEPSPTVAKKTVPPPPARKSAPAPIAKQPKPSPPTAARSDPKGELAATKPPVEKKTPPAPVAKKTEPKPTLAPTKPTLAPTKPTLAPKKAAPVPTPGTSQTTADALPAKPDASERVVKPGTKLAGTPAKSPTSSKSASESEKLEAGKTAKRPARPGPPKVAQPTRAATPAPAAPKPGSGIDLLLWGGVAAGTLLVLVVAALVMRRRSLPNDMDVTAVAEGHAADGAIPDGGFSMEESPADAPFASPMATSFSDAAPGAAPEVESKPAEVDIAAGPGLFDDEDPEKENERMDLENSGREQTASEMPTQLGGGAAGAGAGDADVSRLVRELERRMAQMETRLDEATEARERLERQVAAQAEELRVQRAAIARTQRALRSLNRPAEEQATEPAIREPSS